MPICENCLEYFNADSHEVRYCPKCAIKNITKLVFDFTSEEKKRASDACNMVIDALRDRGLSVKEKWLVISTLYGSFPKEALREELLKKEGGR